jgi:hypothetical protein
MPEHRYKPTTSGRNLYRRSVYFRGAGQTAKDSTYDLAGIGEQANTSGTIGTKGMCALAEDNRPPIAGGANLTLLA